MEDNISDEDAETRRVKQLIISRTQIDDPTSAMCDQAVKNAQVARASRTE